MSGAAVELREVSKLFAGHIAAVDKVSLRVAPGKIVALLGPSGCGKTTTLRLINRLEEPTSGQVLVRGQDVQTERPEALRRSIGYVIQEAGLFPHWDVSANVALVPGLLGWPRERIRARVSEILDLVGLPEKEFGRRRPAELSGGQRQRVGVARGLAADPDLVLMDEPFGALDPGTRIALQDEFLRLQRQLKKTVVMVTHDLTEAGKLADEIVLLDRGQVLQQGTLRDLLLKPANPRVRTFLGRQGAELALETLSLHHVLDGVPVVPARGPSLSLAGTTRLSQVILALSSAASDATVIVDNDPARAHSAKALRDTLMRQLQEPSAN